MALPETCGGCGREREIRDVLDGDRLCQTCCDRWAREEGEYEQYLAEQERQMSEQLDAEESARDAA